MRRPVHSCPLCLPRFLTHRSNLSFISPPAYKTPLIRHISLPFFCLALRRPPLPSPFISMGPYKLHIPGPQSSASLPLHRPDELDKLESEAGQMLRNCSTREVGLVLLFPFENPDTPVELLSQRPEHELDEILQSLPPREHDHTGRCNDDIINLAKARAIVQRLKLDCSTAACMWTPDRESGLDEDQIPTAINRHIFRKEYCNVDFTEVLRAACGLRSQNIENLYACANQLYLWCQDSHPPQRRGIIEVSTVTAWRGVCTDRLLRNYALNTRLHTSSFLPARISPDTHPISLMA
jgi:hypothetical protein